ncbi:MAG: glycerophosphodiester phosphodiesterase [Gemmatimonadaceae bacterium]
MNILLEPGARIVVGHRGNRAHAPENTIESFAQAVALGADAIEFDVHMSADGIPVVHHDPTIMRTTDGVGEIARLTFDELRKADAGANFTKDGGKTFPYRGAGHRIPRLEEVIEAFPVTAMIVEIKEPLASTGVLEVLKRRNAIGRVLVDSFKPEALRVFAGSEIALGASHNGMVRILKESLGARSTGPVGFKAICTPTSYYGMPLPVKRFANVARKYGVRVHVWTINDTRVARDLWLAGINGIITDDPGSMLDLRARITPSVRALP